MNILIIDDNENLALKAIENLNATGNYDIDTVQDGATALDILKQCKYDIIILDVVLPKVSGISLLENIRKEQNPNKNSFIIVTSSITHPSLVENASKLGADYFITKPYKVESLIDAIEVYKQIESLSYVTFLNPQSSHNVYSSSTKDMFHSFPDYTEHDISQSTKIHKFCDDFLKEYEISEKFKGYDLIVKAFTYILEHSDTDELLVTKDIYPYLAKITNTEVSSVERNIRNAIKCAKCKKDEQKMTNLTFLLKMKKSYKSSNLK